MAPPARREVYTSPQTRAWARSTRQRLAPRAPRAGIPPGWQHMSIRSRPPRTKRDLFWILLSLIVLLPSLDYPLVAIFRDPDFALDASWRVLEAQPCASAECLKLGDRVQAIGKLDFATFSRSRTIEL